MAQQVRQNQNTGGNPPPPPPPPPPPQGGAAPQPIRPSLTEKSYCTARETYCTALQNARKDRDTAREVYNWSLIVYNKRKELFEWTEKNYRMYRDLDLCLDVELTTGNTCLTTNVQNYNTLSQTLQTTLNGPTGLTANLKKLKTLVLALRDRASDLENFRADQCNASQWSLLTGENVENCNPPVRAPRDRPNECRDSAELYYELISITRKSLVLDVDLLIAGSADVTGIHTFSNVGVLTTLQQQLSTAAANFVQQIKTTASTRATDLTKTQNDLQTAAQDCTKAGVDNFNKISVWSGCHYTLEFLCNPPCVCVRPLDPKRPEPRLHDCECRICEIGKKIKVDYPGSPYVLPSAPATSAPAAGNAPANPAP